MSNNTDLKISRRFFIKSSAALAGSAMFELSFAKGQGLKESTGEYQYTSLRLLDSNQLVLKLDRPDLGQGVATMLASLVAAELQISPARIQLEIPGVGESQWHKSTAKTIGGSNSTRQSWLPIAEMSAVFADLFVRAAAAYFKTSKEGLRLSKEPEELSIELGERKVSFVELLAQVGGLEPAENISPKRLKEYYSKKSLGIPDRVSGALKFGVDVVQPGMLAAVIQRIPYWAEGYELKNRQHISKLAGVKYVVDMPNGIAIVGTSFWICEKARKTLDLQFEGELPEKALSQLYEEALAESGEDILLEGDAKPSGENAQHLQYRQQVVAQTPLEPLNCLAKISNGRVEVWTSTQRPSKAREFAAETAGVPIENVIVHCENAGGGFGRRLESDFVAEAVFLSRETGETIKLYWTKEDELKGGFYRPAVWVDCKVTVSESGSIDHLEQKLIGPGSIWNDYPADFSAQAGSIKSWVKKVKSDWIDPLLSDPKAGELKQGLNFPYKINSRRVKFHSVEEVLSTGYWRGVGHNHNVFAIESLLDEVCLARGFDSLDYRIKIAKDERLIKLLEFTRSVGYWERDKRSGLAVCSAYGSYVVVVLNLTGENDKVALESVYCAVDCGMVVNPDVVKQQIEGGIAFGLSAALYEEISLESGEIAQSNFYNYRVLRYAECPDIEVKLLTSGDEPGGVGELAVPAVAPALCNALHRYVGKRFRYLPLAGQLNVK